MAAMEGREATVGRAAANEAPGLTVAATAETAATARSGRQSGHLSKEVPPLPRRVARRAPLVSEDLEVPRDDSTVHAVCASYAAIGGAW